MVKRADRIAPAGPGPRGGAAQPRLDGALLPTGLRDVLPPQAAHEADIVERLVACFAGHGYQRVKPPLIEFEESLLGLLEAERRTADSEASVEALHLDPPSYAYGSEGRAEMSLEGYQKLLDAARWFLERGGEGEAVFDPAEAPVPRPRSQLRIRPRL